MLTQITNAAIGMIVLAIPSAFALHLLNIALFTWQSALACAILIFVSMCVASVAKTEIVFGVDDD